MQVLYVSYGKICNVVENLKQIRWILYWIFPLCSLKGGSGLCILRMVTVIHDLRFKEEERLRLESQGGSNFCILIVLKNVLVLLTI
jgi:hypothetical protein